MIIISVVSMPNGVPAAAAAAAAATAVAAAGVVDPNGSKRIGRVESLKNLILHGKTQPDLPPDVFTFPACSCRHTPTHRKF